MFVRSLARYDIADVRAAVSELGCEEITPGQTRWPELGRFMRTVQRRHAQRVTPEILAGRCSLCRDTCHPGMQPVYREHVSRRTGAVSRVVVALRPCPCRHAREVR